MQTAAPGPAPHTTAPPHLCAALDRCFDEAEQAMLFLLAYDQHPPLFAIRLACAAGYGCWISPAPPHGPGSQRPATHLFEVTLFGIAATAQTADQCAANWITVANRLLHPEDQQ